MRCEKCKKPLKNISEIKMVFNILDPSTMSISSKHKYKKLSMADTIHFRDALHQALDNTLDKISTSIFIDQVDKIKKVK